MFTKMGKQIGIWITLFILTIECGILVMSYNSRRTQLNELKIILEKEVGKTGHDFHKVHPGILDDAHIESMMNDYVKNIFVLSIIIAFITSLGTMYVFHQLVGRHVLRLKRLNTMNRGTKIARWAKNDDVPLNEVGELVLEREDLINRIGQTEGKGAFAG